MGNNSNGIEIEHNSKNEKLLMTYLFCLLFLLTGFIANAQYSDNALYLNYLTQDMSLWGKYLETTDFNKLSNKERQRYLNYEYGYIAFISVEKSSKVQTLIKQFNSQLEQMSGKMPESTRLTYLSAAAAYAITQNKLSMLSNGAKTLMLSKQAIENDPNDPIALTMRGSLFFYCPKTFGGDKQQALNYLIKAEKIFRERADTINNWNYRSAQMIIAQCYEKTDRKEQAIVCCKKILHQEPNFSYIRDFYLPELQGKRTKKGTDPQAIGSSFVKTFGE